MKKNIALAIPLLTTTLLAGSIGVPGWSPVAACLEDAQSGQSIAAHELEAALQRLHLAFLGVPGFVDVYFDPTTDPPFTAVFEQVVPVEASAVRTDLTVGLAVLPGQPIPMGPGTMPSTGDIVCSGFIRPGAQLSGGCTLSFMFANGTHTFAGTAGHCVSTGQSVSVVGISGSIGTVVFSTGNGGVGNDFALIQVAASKLALVTPEMCNWAGPTGTNSGAIQGDSIVHTGRGQWLGVGVTLPPRPRAYIGNGWGATSFSWLGGAIGGDSGSAIRLAAVTSPDQADALGTVTHSLGVVVGTPTLGYGTRWDRGIALASAAGIPNLSLLTVNYVHGL